MDMFRKLPGIKSIPSAIGLPFLSSQEDAQLKFRSGDNGIKRLYSDESIPLSDFGYWAQYYTLFSSATDVYSLISVQDVRQTLNSNPANLANLLLTLSHHIFTLLPSDLFPSSSSSLGSSQQDTTKEALNCLRVLGRVIVVIYEAEADARGHGINLEETFAGKWLWRRMPIDDVRRQGKEMGDEDDMQELEMAADDPGASSPASAQNARSGQDTDDPVGAADESQFTIADDSDDEGDIGRSTEDEGARAFKAVLTHPQKVAQNVSADAPASASVQDPLSQPADKPEETDGGREEDDTLPCLVDRLFMCTIDLLFCAGFTVPENVRGLTGIGDKINYVIWEKGVGSTVSVGSTADLDRNKTEVLRFMMILLSSTIYTPPHALAGSINPPLEHLTHSLERRLVLSLLCSFLNTSLTSSKSTSGMTGQIPYNHLISKAAEERRTLVRTSMMVLLVAMDYRKVETGGIAGQMGEAKEENAFRYFVSKLHRKEDFAFILGGLFGILEEYQAVSTGYLPGSKRPVPYILETFMLLWRMVDLNKRFRAYLFDSGKAVDVIVHILLTCLDLKDDPSHHGLLRLLSYLLQTLSADKAFALALNQTIRLPVPAKWAVAGTAADFMIVSIYSIATTPGLNQLFPALTISVANVAPYLTNIGVQASTRLMQLFKAFSSPNFLLADDGHPRLVYYLLETINAILYFQLNENPNFVYAVLRSHQDFQTLATFTLMSGLRDIQKRKALRAADSPKGLQRTDSELDMLAEKTALLSGQDIEEGFSPTSPSSPTDERSQTTISLMTPSENESADPLAATSPTSPPPATTISSPSRPMSEKARGKMRATESSMPTPDGTDGEPEVPDEELLKVAQAGVGPNGYIPTQEWVSSWQKGLPLDPVLVAISELLPKVQDTQRPSGAPSTKVFNLLKEVSLVDVLPTAPPIIPRKFQIWLTSLLWGDIYVASLTGVSVWRDTTVKLFGVKQAPVKGRSAQVGRVLKMIGVV